MDWNTVHWAYQLALRLVVMADTLGAERRIDFVDFRAQRYRLVGALRLAQIAIDAAIGDRQRHVSRRYSRGVLASFSSSQRLTDGETNLVTSPPRVAISRTSVAETNW